MRGRSKSKIADRSKGSLRESKFSYLEIEIEIEIEFEFERRRGFSAFIRGETSRETRRTARVEAKSRGGDTHVAYAVSNERL